MASVDMNERVNLAFFTKLEISGKRKILEYCVHVGLIADKYDCPKCNLPMELTERKDLTDGFSWSCRGKGAHHVKRSIRCGSWFEESKLDLITILKLTYLWIKKTGSAWIIDELGVSKNTVSDWMKFCREVCIDSLERDSMMLGGPGIIVEVDERKLTKRKFNRGKQLKGEWIFGGVERGTNKYFVRVVENRGKNVLLNVLRKYVRPGTVVISDCWKFYNCLQDEGFVDLTVNHSVTFKDPATGDHTKTFERMWNSMKHSSCGIRKDKDHFDSYLAEFMWWRLHKDDVPKMYDSFIISIKALYPPAFKDLPRGDKRSHED